RIATNLARDRLRKRKREGYKGPFVPSPIEEAVEQPTPEARYDLTESASLAFLVALEALSAKARAVLILRDVMDYSVEETARVLDMSEGSVKVAHHRARRLLERWEKNRERKAPDEVRAALQRFVIAIASGDAVAAKSMLADDAVCLQDAGGEFFAAGIEL